MSDEIKQILVHVPSQYVEDFKSSHTGVSNGTPTDDYYNRVSFLENGQISTHGKIFGLDNDSITKIGVSALPSNQTSIGSYLVELAGKYDILNGALNQSVQSYVASAVTALVGGAPEALDTLGEIAELLTGGQMVTDFASLQTQVGTRPKVDNEGTLIDYPGDLYQYASYISQFKIDGLTYSDSAVTGQYVSSVSQSNGKISVERASLPSREDTAVSGQYVSQVTQSNGQITVSRANLPTLAVNSTAGSAGQYISALSVSGHTITATYTTLPSVTYAEQTGNYIAAITQTNGLISSVTFKSLPSVPAITIATASQDYLTVDANDNHKIGAVFTSLGTDASTIWSTSTSNGHTTYSLGTAETIANGFVTASNIYARFRADEEFVASALTTIDGRISAVVSSATNDLDTEITVSDASSYVSITLKETDGLITTTGSSVTFDYASIYAALDSTTTYTGTYGSIEIEMQDGVLVDSTLTIDKDAILQKTSYTYVGGASTDPIQVTVTEENHGVKAVGVNFDISKLWQDYQPAAAEP